MTTLEWDEKQCERCNEVFKDNEVNDYGLCKKCQEIVDENNKGMQATYDSLRLL